MQPIKDDRRFIKLLDYEYHKTQPGFNRASERILALNSGITTVRLVSGGGYERTVCIYGGGREEVLIKPGTLLYRWSDVKEILSCFEDTTNISDEEWTFFCVVMPDQRQKLGRTTESFAGIELFLSGNGNFSVE